jgi:hypothetical protein
VAWAREPAPAWAGTAVLSCKTQHLKHTCISCNVLMYKSSGAGKLIENKIDMVGQRIDNQQA